MISPTTASAALSVASGLLKLGHRVDQLLAEKAAVQAKLVQVMPAVYSGPSALQKVAQLKTYLAAAAPVRSLDPLGSDRADLVAELKKEEPDNAVVGECYALVFPERLALAPLDPDAEYLAALRDLVPTIDLSNEDTLAAAFAITAGHDQRGLNYTARLGLLVADVIAEHGAENTGRFIRDPQLRTVAHAVLQRFAQPQLEEFTEWNPLLRHALGATLNGALDARSALAGDTRWLPSLLEVLAEARATAPAGDEFLLGLFRGRSYGPLVSAGLTRAAAMLAEDQADVFKQIAAELLKTAAPLAADSDDFKCFFSDHWGDLLRAGLAGLERQSPALLADQPELVRDVLGAMVRHFREIPQAELLSSATLFHLGDAAIAAVAAKPELLTAKVGSKPWLKVWLESFVKTVARDGVQVTFGRANLDAIVTRTAALFAEHPELIIDDEDAALARTLVGGLLKSVSQLSSLDARALAHASVEGTLTALAANPQLLGTRYTALITEFTARLAEFVQDGTLQGIDAGTLVTAAIRTVLANPGLFHDAKANLALITLNAVLDATGKTPDDLLDRSTRLELVRTVLAAVAAHGREKLIPLAQEKAAAALTAIVGEALAQARAELGRRITQAGIPPVVGGLVAAWARGDITAINPKSPAFKKLLAQLVASVLVTSASRP